MNSFLLCLGFLLLSTLSAQTTWAAEIQSVFPTGSVKQVQQVVVKFSNDMVPLGDPRSTKNPLNLKCNSIIKKANTQASTDKNQTPTYTTRWADTKTWSLDFNKPLAAGMKCTLTLNEFKDLYGTDLKGLSEYTFTTSGPAILQISPYYGDIEPEQYFLIQVDGAIDTNSLEKISYFEVAGLPDKVNVKVMDGSVRDEIIRAAVKSNWRWNEFENLLASKKSISSIAEFQNFILIKGTRRFPERAKVVYHWPEGILSKSGLPVEEAQQFQFQVIPPFEVSFNCERTNPARPCNPILDMRLNFTNRVPLKSLVGTKLIAKNGSIWEPKELFNGDQNKNGAVGVGGKTQVGVRVLRNFADEQVDALTFEGPFPDNMSFEVVLPKNLKDELARPLSNANSFPLKTATDEYSPLIKFAAPFGLIESKADPVLPLSVRNVEKQIPTVQTSVLGQAFAIGAANAEAEVIKWFQKVNYKYDNYELRGTPLLAANQGQKLEIKKPANPKEFEVMGIPLPKNGFYVVEMQSPSLGQFLLGGGTMYVAAAALVTNLSVHFKQGRESSLIWVTYLDSAKPVADAEVSIYDAKAKQLIKGKTNKEGIFKTSELKYPCGFKLETNDTPNFENDNYSSDYPICEVFAFAKKDDDFSFVSNRWHKGIEDYRFNLAREYLAPQWGPAVAHTILNRSLLQAAESIKMKHLLREHSIMGFKSINPTVLPKRVLIVHQGSQKTYTLPFQFDKSTGTALNEFVVPKDALLGTYDIYLSNKKALPAKESHDEDPFDWSAQATGSFVVSEYRLPLMRAQIKIQGEKLIRPSKVNVDLSASYLSGGPAKKLPIKLRSTVIDGDFTPQITDAESFRFFSEPVITGVRDANSSDQSSEENKNLLVQDLKLNEDGGVLATIDKIPEIKRIKSLFVEMEYRDPNGEIKTAVAEQNLFPAEFIVGLKTESWISEPSKVKVSGAITNTEGKLMSGRKYEVKAYQSNYITHRKKIVGGFYAYDSKTEITSIGKICEGVSDDKGFFECKGQKLPAGDIILQAEVKDNQNRSTYANVHVSVFAEGAESWWAPSDSDRIDILPEKNRYEPGETAKIVVRSPFPTSQLLITIEREGVIESFIKEIQRDNPVIEVPIKGHYAPNIFVSVLALRGRVGEPPATHLVDLAKPALKLGMTELRIGWKAHELKVEVQTNKLQFKARDIVDVKIKVKTASGEKLPAGAEVAVAAVDVGLLRLKNNSSWNILEAMMGQRGLAVDTSSSQIEVIGKRHYGSKAKPPGGGGGSSGSDPRELFDPILVWQPRLKLNAQGEATIKVPLNDSITSFKIEAVAQAGLSYFGDGSAEVQSSKDLIIYSGFAPQVRDGDQIFNALTLRNTTTQPMKVKLNWKSPQIENLVQPADTDLAPSEAKTLYLPLQVPNIKKDIEFQIEGTDINSQNKDVLKVSIKNNPSVPERVFAATLFQLENENQIPVKQPQDAIVNSGALRIDARNTLVAGVAGVKSYMNDYDNTCLEQKFSKGIALENKSEVEKLIFQLPSYFDGAGLLKFFPSSACGSAQLTQYVIRILLANDFKIPEEARSRMTAGLQAKLDGHTCYSWWDELVHNNYRDQERVLFMRALSLLDAFREADLSTIQVAPNLWKTETVVAWYELLKKETQIAKREEQLKQLENILRSRVNYQGSLMNLQGTLDWESAWHLFTSNDQEALSVFGLAIANPSWASDIGKMARGITARLKRGIWDTTMANAWGVTQLRKFSAQFEKEKVTGVTTYEPLNKQLDWSKQPAGELQNFAWPETSAAHETPIRFNHKGTGKPWILMQTLSAVPLKSPLDMGYNITRKLTPVSQKITNKWSSGDVMNIELTITAKYDQAWVVVKDPIPAGASHLGFELDGNSMILDRTPRKPTKTNGPNPWPAEFEEKSLSSYKTYAAYLPKGIYQINYRIRLNSAGEFKLPQTRVEAMYAPETFGEVPNAPLKVLQ